MAAAVALAERGVPVTVFESAQQLGGRARGLPLSHRGITSDLAAVFGQPSRMASSSIRDGEGETQLDNGQHLLLGCYRQTLRMIEQVGGNIEKDFLRLPLQLDLHGEFSLKAPRLPAPLHLLVALLRSQGLTFGERLNAARFMFTLRRMNFILLPPRKLSPIIGGGGVTSDLAGVVRQPSRMASSSIRGEGKREDNDITVIELLTQHKQDAALVQKLWEPLCIAALNTPIHKASAQVLLNVLRDALNRSRADSDMLLPRIDFTALFPQRAADYVEQHGGKVFTSCGVEAIIPKVDGIELRLATTPSRLDPYSVRPEVSKGESDESLQRFSHVICAAPPVVAAKLLRPIAALAETVAQIDALEHQPIYTVYLQYPAHIILPHPMLGLHQRYSQWLFDKGQISGQHGLLAAVISAEGIHQELSQDELAQKVIAELREEFGITEQPVWFKVIAEKRATFCCSPNLQRPLQLTPLPRLLLAGDYTAGDYPATLEGAVMSGLKCADVISA
jgi:hydroxysqualene dehydroxylase